jgi:hypothetical protein
MSLYVFILKSTIEERRGRSMSYMLSSATTIEKTRENSSYWADKEDALGRIEIVKLAIPVDEYEKFREQQNENTGMGTYCSSETIAAFKKLNDKYQQESLKLIAPASGSAAGEVSKTAGSTKEKSKEEAKEEQSGSKLSAKA